MPMKGGRLVNFSLLNEKQLNHRTCIGIHNALEVFFFLGGGEVSLYCRYIEILSGKCLC